MKTDRKWLWLLLFALTFQAFPTTRVAAASRPWRGFVYGAHINLEGDYLVEALLVADQLNLDWLAVEFDWAESWPDPVKEPDFIKLDIVMGQAAEIGSAVLLSIRNAPEWVQTAEGPDADLTSSLVVRLVERYPAAFQAVELFPAANTRAGWGTIPNAPNYTHMINTVYQAVKTKDLDIQIVIGGLVPVALSTGIEGISDEDFLQELYSLGAIHTNSVISLQLSHVVFDQYQTIEVQGETVLRHYEKIRQVMLANQHQNGQLWITHFSPPSDRIYLSTSELLDIQTQSDWLIKAYRQLRAQLYVGAVFYDSLNPPRINPEASQAFTTSLIRSGLTRHPFSASLEKLVAQNHKCRQLQIILGQPQVKQILKDRG